MKHYYAMACGVLALMLLGCGSQGGSDQNQTKQSSSQSSDQVTQSNDTNITQSVTFQSVGKRIEGISICLESTCQKTDASGKTTFKSGGRFSVRLNQIELKTIDTNETNYYLSPYSVYDTNDTMAQWLERYLVASATTQGIEGNKLELNATLLLSSNSDFATLLTEGIINNTWSYEVAQTQISIDGDADIMVRGSEVYDIPMTSKSTYESATSVQTFIDAASKGIVLNNTQALQPDEYSLQAEVQDDTVMIIFEVLETAERSINPLVEVNATHLRTDIDTFVLQSGN